MIVCHERKLIFLKTKKVGGTSLEIALAGQCGPNCIITPISNMDEKTRQALGYRGPQNFQHGRLRRALFKSPPIFTKHMAAREVRAKLPAQIWNNYRHFTIVRNPYDRLISRYFWDVNRQRTAGLNFDDYVEANPRRLTENLQIAPLSGPDELNIFLRYEHLKHDLESHDLGFLWDTYKGLSAKSGHRPAKGGSVAEMYAAFPSVARRIEEVCGAEIQRFGYASPI